MSERPTPHSGHRLTGAAAAVAVVAVVALVVGGALVLRAHGGSSATASAARGSGQGTAVTVGRSTVAAPIPSGFVGLSMEFRGLPAYAGQNPNAITPALVALMRAIAPNQSSVLRIGGDSTDWSWWPVAGLRRPPGVRYDITPGWMATAHALAADLHARLILGINLEAGNPRLAAAEAAAMVSGIGRASIDALEIGNEPELYAKFGWYRSASGKQVPGRPPGYGVPQFTSDFSAYARSMPPVPLAGPSSGAPMWLAQLGSFLGAEPRVRLATLHAYPLKHCSPTQVVTNGQLLADSSSHGLAEQVAPLIAVAHRHGVTPRLDEMNGVSCGGTRGVSDSFSSALWVLDTLFEMARAGIGGVNIHTVPNTINEVLGPDPVRGKLLMRVHPQYYGMIMFAQAAPAGSRLLALSGHPGAGIKLWATTGPDRHVRVVLINKRLARGAVVRLRIVSAGGPATVERLQAPSSGATSNVTIGGQSFGAETATGVLTGTPQTTTLAPTAGTYVIDLPAASAAMLTLASP